jgi:hypothetical protein
LNRVADIGNAEYTTQTRNLGLDDLQIGVFVYKPSQKSSMAQSPRQE